MLLKNLMLIVMSAFLCGLAVLAFCRGVQNWSDVLSVTALASFCIGVMWWDITYRPGYDPVKRFFRRLFGR